MAYFDSIASNRSHVYSAEQTSGAYGSSSSTKSSGPLGQSPQLANKETFLKLLVAQIKNQNPLNPADGMQFVSQLAQFSELEQVISVRSELEGLRSDFSMEMAALREQISTEFSKLPPPDTTPQASQTNSMAA
jgi:flagellar basal-body rod modification protein FlgD